MSGTTRRTSICARSRISMRSAPSADSTSSTAWCCTRRDAYDSCRIFSGRLRSTVFAASGPSRRLDSRLGAESGATSSGYNAGDDRNRDADLEGAVQPADADLHLHRVQFGTPAVDPHQSVARVAALGTGRSDIDRSVRAHAASLHVEIPLVSSARPLR